MLIVAGPPGSGKSVGFPVRAYGIDAFSIDDRCAELQGGSYQGITPATRSVAVAECRLWIDRHLQGRQSFAVETTLRTPAAIEQAQRALVLGFVTRMVFVATDDPEVNVRRVVARARMGGHAAPAAEVRETWAISVRNLALAVPHFLELLLVDATVDGPPQRIAEIVAGTVRWRAAQLPAWARCVETLPSVT